MSSKYTRPRGQRDPEPTSRATAKQAVATTAAMTHEPRSSGRHAELLAALRTRLGLAADATEATILNAVDKAIAAKRAAREAAKDAYPENWKRG